MVQRIQSECVRSNDDFDLVIKFLEGDQSARHRLPDRLGPGLRRIARRMAPDLARRGIDADIVQHVYVLLLRRQPDHLDPSRTDDVWSYLRVLVRLAVRDVRAQYAAPGTRTRSTPPGDANSGGRPAAGHIPNSVLGPQRGLVDPADAVDVDGLAQAWLGVDELLAAVAPEAPSWVRHVLRLFVMGLSLSEAAAEINRSRFAVRRALDRWVVPIATRAKMASL